MITRAAILTIVAMGMATSFSGRPARADDEAVALAVVNGDTISTADMDAGIMAMHDEADMEKRRSFDFQRLLDKAINDRLLLQEALVLGLNEEPSVIVPVLDRRMQAAISAYSRDNVALPDSVEDAVVRQVFEDFYWRMQVRQISMRTEEEAWEVRAALAGGAPWDSLARAVSLDTHRYRGGLHNLKYWADVENVLRDASRGLGPEDLSEPFPYREAYSVIRVERRVPYDETEYPRLSLEIQRDLLMGRREDAWQAFVDDHLERIPVTSHEEVLARIRADSSVVFRGEFLEGTDDVALSLDEAHVVSDRRLRKAISRQAMTAGLDPFQTHLERGIRVQSRNLVLGLAAERAGYLDDPQIVAAYEADLEKSLVETYLNEMIVPQITFKWSEFEEFYDSHRDDFRGEDEVQLLTMVLDTEETAREVSERLRGGADFEFVRAQYLGGGTPPEKAPWTAESVFSDGIRSQLDVLAVGESSEPVKLPNRWLVFRVKNRRPGEVQPLEKVEMTIRQVMFQKKFNELMDEHLALLRERSEIERNEDAIKEYFSAGS